MYDIGLVYIKMTLGRKKEVGKGGRKEGRKREISVYIRTVVL
jgi:hypothetical protein